MTCLKFHGHQGETEIILAGTQLNWGVGQGSVVENRIYYSKLEEEGIYYGELNGF